MGGVESVIINKAGLDTILRAALRVSVTHKKLTGEETHAKRARVERSDTHTHYTCMYNIYYIIKCRYTSKEGPTVCILWEW